MKHPITEEQIAEFHACPYCSSLLNSIDQQDLDSPKTCTFMLCPESQFWEAREVKYKETIKTSLEES